MSISQHSLVRSWEERLGISFSGDFAVGPVEQAALPLADVDPGDFLSGMLDRALGGFPVDVVGFVSREARLGISKDGATPAFPAGLEWCTERVGRLIDRDSPLIGDADRTYIIAQCDRGWFIAAGADFNPRQLTAYARIAGALWSSARERAATAKAAVTEPMTGLFNRLGLDQKIEKLPPRQEVVALYLDLDGLKEANDRGGHAAGDALIIKCSGVLLSTFREEDIVARVGGDEFVVVALGERPDTIIARLRAAFERASVQCSIGAAAVPEDAPTIVEAMTLADSRMYADKVARKGPGRPR